MKLEGFIIEKDGITKFGEENLKKKLFIGICEFENNIVGHGNCFICGEARETKEFNDEHVIPDWVIRKCGLNSKQITLHNQTKIRYNQYKIPCCTDCNSLLGELVEKPMSTLFNRKYEEIIEELKNEETGQNLFKWLCLIFIKTHLKDNFLLLERDVRKNSGYIGNYHPWESLHHVYCISRSFYTNPVIDKKVFGTMIVLKSFNDSKDSFDYIDSIYSKTIMLKIRDITIITVFNDSGAVGRVLENIIKRIKGPITTLQARELYSHANYIKINLENLPTFTSKLNSKLEYEINAHISNEIYLKNKEDCESSVTEFLHLYLLNTLPKTDEGKEILKGVKEGKIGFLFDENGKFINNLEESN